MERNLETNRDAKDHHNGFVEEVSGDRKYRGSNEIRKTKAAQQNSRKLSSSLIQETSVCTISQPLCNVSLCEWEFPTRENRMIASPLSVGNNGKSRWTTSI